MAPLAAASLPAPDHALESSSSSVVPSPAGPTYFLTLRLADALPALARQRLARVRRLAPPEGFVSIDRFLDAGAGACLLARPSCAAVVSQVLLRWDRTRYALGRFVIMPNHVHVLVQLFGLTPLEAVVQHWTTSIAHRLPGPSLASSPFWHEDVDERLVRNQGELLRWQDYIAGQPASWPNRPLVVTPADTNLAPGCARDSVGVDQRAEHQS